MEGRSGSHTDSEGQGADAVESQVLSRFLKPLGTLLRAGSEECCLWQLRILGAVPPDQELCCLPRAQGQPSMLISVVQEASGMCCPLYGEIACGDPFPAQPVNGGVQCFAQEAPHKGLIRAPPL